MSPAHSAHNNNGQVPWAGALDHELDDETYRLEKHDLDEKHHHPPLHYHHHHHDHISTAVCDPATTDAVPARLSTSAALHVSSDQSTPSQTRSTASSTFTPLSGFPSSPSRAYAAADADADRIENREDNATGAADAGFTADEAYADRAAEAGRGNVPLSGIERLSLRGSSQQAPERQPPPSPGLPSSPVPCPQHHNTHSANNDEDDADYDADAGIGNATDIESISSHALSLDQTRLRVAYLVSTMVKPVEGFEPSTECHTQGLGGIYRSVPVPASQQVAVSATRGADRSPVVYEVAVDDVTGAALLPRYQGLPRKARRAMPPVYPLCDLVQWFDNNYPSVWPTADPAKKQQKIYTAAMWQTEVAALGDATYCTCPVGEDIIRRYGLRLLAMAGLANRGNGPTKDASVEEDERSSTSEEPDTASGDADDTDDRPAVTSRRCPQCGHALPPRRPVVWVRGDGWSARAQGAAGDTIRRAFKSLRGLVAKTKKRPGLTKETFQGPTNTPRVSRRHKEPNEANEPKGARSLAAPRGSGEQAQTAQQQQQHGKKTKQGITEPTSSWDQWDQLNCTDLLANPVNAEAFFTRTAIYRNVAEAEERDDDESDWSSSKEGEDAVARELRRKRETGRRLRRAQRLLMQTNAPQASAAPAMEADAAGAATAAAEEPAELAADEPADAAPSTGPAAA